MNDTFHAAIRRLVLLIVVLLPVTGLLLSGSAMAGGKGKLYVASYLSPDNAKNKDGVQYASVFIYTPKGAQISSGKGGGAWLPGQEIPLPAGEYWVALGQDETQYNLFHYTVEDGKTTVVDSGWVSVATLPLAEQPLQDCAQVPATIRAYVDTGSKRAPIIGNDTRKPDEYGAIQLHPGEHLVEWRGMMVTVTVEGGKDYRLPTGFVGPSAAPEAYLLRNQDDDPRKKGVPICTDGAMHVLAGTYWVRELIVRNDGAEVNYQTTEYQVDAEGSSGYSSLGTDRPANAKAPAADDGRRITSDEVKKLSEWGTKKSDFDELDMFGADPL